MLSNVAIKSAINDMLKKATGLKIYGREVTEGYTTPSLFVELLGKPFERESKNFAKTGFTAMITYFQSSPDELEQLKLINIIREAFGMNTKIEDRILTVGKITYEYTGEKREILQISAEFNFYENTTEKEMAEVAKEYNLNMKKED